MFSTIVVLIYVFANIARVFLHVLVDRCHPSSLCASMFKRVCVPINMCAHVYRSIWMPKGQCMSGVITQNPIPQIFHQGIFKDLALFLPLFKSMYPLSILFWCVPHSIYGQPPILLNLSPTSTNFCSSNKVPIPFLCRFCLIFVLWSIGFHLWPWVQNQQLEPKGLTVIASLRSVHFPQSNYRQSIIPLGGAGP